MRIAEAVAPAVNSFVASGDELDGGSLLGVLPEALRPKEVATLVGIVEGYSVHEHPVPYPVPAEIARVAFLLKLGKAAVELGDRVTADSSLSFLQENYRGPIARRVTLVLSRCIDRNTLNLKAG
jgi:hypothetical protein